MRRFGLDLKKQAHSAPIPLGRFEGQRDPSGKAAGLSAWISLKSAGNMGKSDHRVLPERIRYLGTLGFRADRTVYSCRQVHSKTVVVVTDQDAESLAGVEADGLITMRRDVVLAVTVADCLPIFLIDRDHGAFAVLHSGWRGTGIVVQALRRMEEQYASRPSRIAVSIGPGIGSCCYRVGEERYLKFRDRFGERSVRRQENRYYLDLAAANAELLRGLGIKEIYVCGNCTACTPQLSSYRRDGPAFAHMLACIGEDQSD
jgi:YfiH family protein